MRRTALSVAVGASIALPFATPAEARRKPPDVGVARVVLRDARGLRIDVIRRGRRTVAVVRFHVDDAPRRRGMKVRIRLYLRHDQDRFTVVTRPGVRIRTGTWVWRLPFVLPNAYPVGTYEVRTRVFVMNRGGTRMASASRYGVIRVR